MEKEKNLDYWKKNAEEDYMKVPISVLRYITELERRVEALSQHDVSVSVCKLDALKDGYCENYRCKADCIGCDFYKQTEH